MDTLLRVVRPIARQDLASAVRHEQLKLLAGTVRLFTALGLLSVVLVSIEFRDAVSPVLAAAFSLILMLHGLLLLDVHRWVRGGRDQLFLRHMLALLLMLGFAWAILVNALAQGADANQRQMLGAIVIALASTPLVAVPVWAALAFWVPSAASANLFICSAHDFDPVLLLCFDGYACFTLTAIVILNAFMLDRSIGRIMLEQQNRTINLFLQTYETEASDWLWEIDGELRLRHVSGRFATAARRSRQGLEGEKLANLLRGSDRCPPVERATDVPRLLSDQQPFRDVPVALDLGGGDCRWWMLTGQPVFDADAVFRGYRGIGSDITEMRRAQERIQHLAMHDSLTGLANRQAFMDRLGALCVAAGSSGRDGAVQPAKALLLLDLDRFKAVNDTFGHEAGNELLLATAHRLRDCSAEDALVARFGGDEFAVLAPLDEAGPTALAQRVVDALAVEVPIAGTLQAISASVGVTTIDAGSRNAASCLREADLALSAAKDDGRGGFRLFSADMALRVRDRRMLRDDLRDAIRHNGLQLVFQPIFDLRTGQVVSVEALCRWLHPRLGAVAPAEFIPLAEESGLIGQLGSWTLHEACRTAAAWSPTVRVAVNVSPLQIRNASFASEVSAVLEETGLRPERLELELTEHAYLDSTDDTLGTMRTLRDVGIGLVLDDFGIGYSSLSYLVSFTFDAIKIDASFIKGLDIDPARAAVVRAIVRLARDLGISLTAEGVEAGRQERMLAEYGIHLAQGFLLQEPVDADGIRALLVAQPAPPVVADPHPAQ